MMPCIDLCCCTIGGWCPVCPFFYVTPSSVIGPVISHIITQLVLPLVIGGGPSCNLCGSGAASSQAYPPPHGPYY